MSRIRPGYLHPHSFDRWINAKLRVREEPDADEEEEDDEEENGDEEEEDDDGYSE